MSKAKIQRLEEESARASEALEKAEVKAREAREVKLRAVEAGEGVAAARAREEDARAAVTAARREASDVAEVLRKARDEEEARRRESEVREIIRDAERLAADVRVGIGEGAALAAQGLVRLGQVFLDSVGSELAGDALEGVGAPRAGCARLRGLEVGDAINAALEAAYARPNVNGPAWVEEIGPFRIVVARCEPVKK